MAVALALFALPAAVAADDTPIDVEPVVTGIEAPIIIEATDPSINTHDAQLIEEMTQLHDDFEEGATRSVVEPVLSWPSAAATNSGFTVTFDATHTPPANVQAVILAAAQSWDNALATSASGPVEIAVMWRDLGSSSLLGSAGPNGLYASGALPTSSFYAAGHANTLLGFDINGASNPELVVNLNSTPNWYIGTSGNPSSGQIDLLSVVLREIGHGLGFLGSASVNNGGYPSPTLDNPSFVFDESVTHNGQPLLSLGNANSLLQSNNLYLNTSSGLQEKLYAPASWQEGSSFSHFDESSNPPGTPGALMTPSIGVQQVERDLDSSVLGVFARMGWPMRVTAATPSIGSVTAVNGTVSVSWSTDLNQVGLAPDGHRVEAWRGGTILESSVTVGAAQSSASLTQLQNGFSYSIRVIPYAAGVDGTLASTTVSLEGVPGPPAVVTSTGAGLQQTVSWTPASGAGITGYSVERSTDGATWYAVGSTTTYSLETTVPEGIHQFRVRADNAHGAGAYGYSIPAGISAGVVRPVALDGQISRLYQAYFLREPDAAGFGYWQGERAAGASLQTISGAFAASNEFTSTYGQLSDGAFINLVYQNVFGRPPDGPGYNYWVGLLASGVSRGEVMVGLSESAEYVANTGTTPAVGSAEDEIYRLYVAFFLRFPDASGFNYWVSVRKSGASLESVAAAFASSTEFVTTYGSLPDSQFVDLVYNNVLGRSADPAGSGYWQGQLAAGVDRGAVMVGFSESAEFVMSTGTLP